MLRLKESIFKVIENRYYSNHGPIAQAFEDELREIFPDYEIVTYASLELLLIAVVDELDIQYFSICPIDENYFQQKYFKLLENFRAKKFQDIEIQIRQESHNSKIKEIFCDFDYRCIYVSNATQSAILVGLEKQIGQIKVRAGLVLTKDTDWAETVRWSRSSYGRTFNKKINIMANGRFSELQAILIKNG